MSFKKLVSNNFVRRYHQKISNNGLRNGMKYVIGSGSILGLSTILTTSYALCDNNDNVIERKIIKKNIIRDDNVCKITLKQKDLNEMFNIIFNWFWLWDTMVMKEGNEEQNEENYKNFVLNNFDPDWQLTVNGDGFVDKHNLQDKNMDDTDIDWFEFQIDMARQFESSYSCISPLSLVSVNYNEFTKETTVLMRGQALGNMTVRNKRTNKKEMMRTHQSYNLTFIKRNDSDRWRLLEEVSKIHVLESNKNE